LDVVGLTAHQLTGNKAGNSQIYLKTCVFVIVGRRLNVREDAGRSGREREELYVTSQSNWPRFAVARAIVTNREVGYLRIADFMAGLVLSTSHCSE